LTLIASTLRVSAGKAPGARAGRLRLLDTCGVVAVLLGCGYVIALTLKGFAFDVIGSNFSYMMQGLRITWELAILSFGVGLLVGIIIAVARDSDIALLRWAAKAYVELLRNVPQLMVIFWVYFLLPAVTGHSINEYLAAVVALTACISAYLAEVVRAGINSVPRTQMEAAYSTGCTYLQAMRLIVLPQALRNMIPSLVNQFVSAFKTTSLVYIIGVIEFFRAASIVNERDFKSMEIFTFVGFVYFVNCFCMSTLARWYERRLQRKREGR
jgi:His/Glu/Gln/Arg/opine family amino acid ABC transporter permease subunit